MPRIQQGPRLCDCGCRRPAVVFLLEWDLGFASRCSSRVSRAKALEAKIFGGTERVDAKSGSE